MALFAGAAAEVALGPLPERYRCAAHEAAHCVAYYFSGKPATFVSINPPDAETGGYTLNGAKNYMSAIRVPGRTFATSDQRAALLFLHMGDPGAGWKKLLGRMRIARRRAEEFVRFHLPIIKALGDRLLEAGELNGEQIQEVIQRAIHERGAARLRELQAEGIGDSRV